jgi:probable phosphoglycerate mutase
MRLLLIRHGQTPSNVAGILDSGFPGAGLTALGHTQAAAVPAALDHEDIAGIYVSPLIRTQLTAAPLAAARGLSPQITDGLQEIFAGDLERRTGQDAVDAYHHPQDLWLGGDLDATIPGSEDGHAFWARYTAALRSIADSHRDGDTVAVVSHGAAIRVFTALATGFATSLAEVGHIRNTAMATLAGDPDRGWEIESWHRDPLGGRHLLGETEHDVTADEDAEAADSTSA